MKKRLVLWITFLCLMVIPAVSVPANAAQVSLNYKTVTMKVGQKKTLKLFGTNRKGRWKSSNKKIATVSKNGVIKAKKKGSAKITVKIKGKKYVCKVKVKSKKSSGKTSSKVTGYFSGDMINGCKNGGSYTLNVTKYPTTTSINFSESSTTYKKSKSTTWSISNSDVASIKKTGTSTAIITIKKTGTVKIYAAYQGKTYSFTLNIKDPDVGYKVKRQNIYTAVGINSNMKDQYKAFLLAKWICDHVRYYSGKTNGQTYEEALDDGTAVCAGYANLYRYLLEGQNIDCNYVSTIVLDGMKHAFNQVKIDGEYYNVDVSWMDSEDGKLHMNNFLQATDSSAWKDSLRYDGIKENVGHGTKTVSYCHPATSYRFDYNKLCQDSKIQSFIQEDRNNGIYSTTEDTYSPWLIGTWSNY